VPEDLLESELFGHERARSPAPIPAQGKIEMADGGTLFLDEVGAISLKMLSVDLLRVLDTKEVTRVGGTRGLKVDFRVICATNENLERAVKEGRFREDFYYRVNVFTIDVPPCAAGLRHPQLAEHFVRRFAQQMDKRITGISPEAMAALKAHDWPGNVRELANAVERAMVVGRPRASGRRTCPCGARAARRRPGDTLADLEKAPSPPCRAHGLERHRRPPSWHRPRHRVQQGAQVRPAARRRRRRRGASVEPEGR
jgi:transcriptional regulator with GAF, ATPase, and Fis domain